MHEPKTDAIHMSLAPEMKARLRQAIECQHQTVLNMRLVLALSYCREHGLLGDATEAIKREGR